MQAVRMLLETSISCFTYLRALFPEGNFEDAIVPSARTLMDANGNPQKTPRDGSIKVRVCGIVRRRLHEPLLHR